MSAVKPGQDYIKVGGGVLIFNKSNEVLLLKLGRKSQNEIGLWQKPGGTVAYGEKVITAMKREVKEEVGIVINIWGYLPHTDHIIKRDKQHWVAFNYLADIKSGTPKVMEPHKHEEVRWFNLKKLPKRTNQTTRESVDNYLKKRYIKLA